MNCSCSSNQCPHIKYVRTLLETTDKDQLREKEASCQKSVPYLQKVVCHIVTGIKVLFYIWLTLAKVSLQLWLHVLESNRYTDTFPEQSQIKVEHPSELILLVPSTAISGWYS